MVTHSADYDALCEAVEGVLIAYVRRTEAVEMPLAAALDRLQRCRFGTRVIPPARGDA